MRQIFYGFSILIFFAFNAQAQFNETIRTGRPGQAIGPFAVGKNVFQIQAGVDLGGYSKEANNSNGNSIVPNSVFRYGLNKYIDVNAYLEYKNEKNEINNFMTPTSGLSAAFVGLRVGLHNGSGYEPSVGMQTTFKLPIVASAYNPQYVAPKILLIATQKISDKFGLLLNTGINYNGNTPKPNGVYVANLGYSISDKWGTYLENYGSFDDNSFESRWDTGLSYLYNDNLQLDIYGGMGRNDGLVDYFTSIGFSYRVHSRSTK